MTSMPTRAPRLSMIALVTSVVPCTIAPSSAMSTAARASSASSPVRTEIDGSCGVVSCLCVASRPLGTSTIAKSVNVPPTSIPTRYLASWEGGFDGTTRSLYGAISTVNCRFRSLGEFFAHVRAIGIQR